MGKPYNREERQVIQKRRQAEISQLKHDLEEQIEERKKVKEGIMKETIKDIIKSENTEKRIIEKPNTCIECKQRPYEMETLDKITEQQPEQERDNYEMLKSKINVCSVVYIGFNQRETNLD